MSVVLKNGFFALLLLWLVSIDAHCDENSSSVMASGNWYKIFITKDGIYRITYTELRNLGINDPANVRIYGSGGSMLPEKADEHSTDDIQEIPIWMYAGSDGVFNEGDYILFYGQGPVVWQYNEDDQTFTHSLHLWDNQSCYFITSQHGGKHITTEEAPSAAITQTSVTFDEHLYYEKELFNPLRSGRYWYGEHFYRSSPTSAFSFHIPDIDLSAPVNLDVNFMARSSTSSFLEANYGGQQIAKKTLPTISGFQYVSEAFFSASFTATSGNISIGLTLNQNGNTSAEGWLDYLRLHARRKLSMTSSQMFFRDTHTVGSGQVTQFQIINASVNTQIWDITDMHQIKRFNTSISGTTLSFAATTDNLREFVAFDASSGWLTPVFQGKTNIDNQNLHAMDNVDMVIVTHPDFMDAAQQLADLHSGEDNFNVAVVTAEQIYNEFSSGMQDPAAIRNFMKLLHEKTSSIKFKYLLLMGDGSYDNKSNLVNNGIAKTNTNFIVTYQSVNSSNSVESYVSDDYFGVLANDQTIKDGLINIGIGRLPVQTAEEAQNAVDKIRRYMGTEIQSDWPNLMGLIADDGDGNAHTSQSESLASYMSMYHPQYTIDKLYCEAFPQVATVDGHRYPEVVQRLDNLLNKGCLLVNYIGHGNETGLAEERLITATSISQWTNKIYPLFVVATCDFGRYDDYVKSSAGESLVLSPSGGGIALLTSTRLVYSDQNFQFNLRFFVALFTQPSEGEEHRLGDMLRKAKNTSSATVNKLCYALLGDPALKPPIPSNKVHTISINGKPVVEPLDTLKANSMVSVQGEITDRNGQKLSNFNGIVHLSLFDKPRISTTLDNDKTAPPMQFTTQNSMLYNGKATVTNGTFELSFVMPRDINQQYGFGKMSYYAYSDNDMATGAFEAITIGGAEPPINDFTGPKIQLFMNDLFFRDGGITDQNPQLIAYLSDENGLNTSGEGIGHDITAVLSNDPTTVYYLNAYYEAALDDHRKGTVTYRFSNLPAGNYELTFTAWDVANNSSQASIHFRVTSSSSLQINNLYNYPNPFSDRTNIYFEHNMPDKIIEVEFQVFDMTGKQLRNIKRTLFSDGYTSGQLQWDGRDANGNKMNGGVYPYRIILRTSTGQTVWEASKMILVP